MNYLINKLTSKKLLLLMLTMLIISYANSYIFPNIWLPWNANVILASSPIFYMGYIYKKRNFKINNLLIVILGLVVIFFSFSFPENVYDMKFAKYGIPIITLASSLILILNIKNISEKLSNYKISYRILSEIGKASMVIMYLHLSIQIILSLNFSFNKAIIFLIATTLSYLIYLLLSKFKFSRAILLGSYNDFEDIFGPLMKPKKVFKVKKTKA